MMRIVRRRSDALISFFAPLDEIFWYGFPLRLLEKGVGNRRNVFNESTIVGSQLYYKVLAVTKLCPENTGRSVYSQYRVQDNKQKSILNVLLMREAHIRE